MSASTSQASSRTVKWTPEMTRIILDYANEAAGNDSIFITDKDAATRQLLTKLQPVTDAKTHARLTRDKIFNKLSKQAVNGGCDSLHEFLQQGTQSLDLSKLQTGTYSPSEIQEAIQRRQNKRKYSSRQNDQDTSKKLGASSSSNQSTSKASKPNDETKKDERPNKRIKLSQPTASLRGQASTRSKRKAADTTTYAETSDGSEAGSRDHEEVRPTRDLRAQSGLGPRLPSQSTTVFVCEICDESFQAKDLLLSHKLSHDPSTSTKDTAESSLGVSSMELSSYDVPKTLEELAILKLAKWTTTGVHADVAAIKSQMMNIQFSIRDATQHFLMKSKIDGNESVALSIQSLEDPLTDLLCSAFGSGPIYHYIESASPLRMGRNEILLSTIGCAITNWALRPLPQGDVRDGLLGEMNELLRGRSPVFQDKVLEMATHQYLEKRIKPLVHEYSRVFAHELFDLLRHFLPDESQSSKSQWPPDISRNQVNQSSGETSSGVSSEFPDTVVVPSESNGEPQRSEASLPESTSHESPHVSSQHTKGLPEWPPKAQTHPQRIFIDELQTTFEEALNLRLEMEMKGNGIYTFDFPLHGLALDLEEHVVFTKSSNEEIRNSRLEEQGKSTKKVLIGMTPAVHGRFRIRGRNEGWREDKIVISRGCVYIDEE